MTVAGLGAGIAAAGLVGSRLAGLGPSPVSYVPPPAPSDEVTSLFGDLPQRSFAGFKIDKIYGVHRGAIPVVMSNQRGERFQLDLLRRDAGEPAGVGNTEALSIYLANQGDGSSPTSEPRGLAAINLAQALARREAAGATPPRLLSLTERQRAFPDAVFSIQL